MLLSATFLPSKFVFYVTELWSLKMMFNSENLSSTMVSVVVSIKNGKGKGHLSSPKTLPFPTSLSKRNVLSVSLPWSRSLAPSEQRLDVGPPGVLFSVIAAGFLARFLHSNTTRSLHCLWQFIPQSVDKTA